MTVQYGESFTWWKLLLRWRGSVWKHCMLQYTVFIGTYLFINILYKHGKAKSTLSNLKLTLQHLMNTARGTLRR